MAKKTAKLFINGRSQAVRLPKEFRFEGKEVLIRREGNRVVLSPLPGSWEEFFKDVPLPSEDFMAERDQGEYQEREDLFEWLFSTPTPVFMLSINAHYLFCPDLQSSK